MHECFRFVYRAPMMQVGDLNKKVGFVYSDACKKQRKLMLLGTKSFKNMITY